VLILFAFLFRIFFVADMNESTFLEVAYKISIIPQLYNDISRVMTKELEPIFLKQIHSIPKNGYLIEVGCGPGFFSIMAIKHRPDLHIICSDFSEAMLHIARENFDQFLKEQPSKSTFDLQFIQANAMNLSQFKDNSFDAVVSNFVIKHIPNPTQFLEEAFRIVKHGSNIYLREIVSDDSPQKLSDFKELVYPHYSLLMQVPVRLLINLAFFRTPPMSMADVWLKGYKDRFSIRRDEKFPLIYMESKKD